MKSSIYTYRLKATVYADGGGDDSFYVQVDEAPTLGYLWDVKNTFIYTHDYVSVRNGADPLEVVLSAGEHSVGVSLREDGARLDRLELEHVAGPPPGPACDGLVREGEDGTLAGRFAIGSDSAASNGAYAHVPDGLGGNSVADPADSAAYCFTVAQAGTYRIVADVYAADDYSDSFFVDAGTGPTYLWDIPTNTTYVSDPVSDRNGDDPVEVDFGVGEQTVTVYLREDGARVDRVELELVSAAPSACDGLMREAEEGTLHGAFAVGSDTSASGGAYVAVPEGTGNVTVADAADSVDYCFTVATAGVYRIDVAVHAPDGFSDSFFVDVDGGTVYLWDVANGTTFIQDDVADRNGADPVEVTLNPGQHTVTVYHREDGARLDTLTLAPVP